LLDLHEKHGMDLSVSYARAQLLYGTVPQLGEEIPSVIACKAKKRRAEGARLCGV